MSSLPYAFTATPDEPATCGECNQTKDHGVFTESVTGHVICGSCLSDRVTAETECYLRKTNPELFTEEARHATEP